MKLSALTKEQKQLMVLVGLVSAIAIFVLIHLVIGPLLAHAGAKTEELRQVQEQLANADRLLGSDARLSAEREAVAAEIERAAREFIAPPENPLSWATEQIYRHARAVGGVDIESVGGGNIGAPWGDPADKKKTRPFAPYRVQITARCGYLELVRLFRAFERNNPYLFVSDLSMSGSGADDERHRITFSIEWPAWSQPKDFKDLTALGRVMGRSVEAESEEDGP